MTAPKHNRKLIEQLTRERDEGVIAAQRLAISLENTDRLQAYIRELHAHPFRNLWNWLMGRQ